MAGPAEAPARRRRGHDRLRREIVTPEGVPLPVTLAQRGERAGALIVDLLIIIVAITALTLIAALGFGGGRPGWATAFVLLVSFALRSFYFIFFELRWHGATPGKRLFGLRVIDRAGGRLRPGAVFARNLMREVELFIPLSLIASLAMRGGGGWIAVLSLVWTLIFLLMPFFNRDFMRAGDIVGGTWVIAAPKIELLPDVAAAAPVEGADEAPRPAYRFSRAQMEVYGIYELQTLEGVLRGTGPNAAETQKAVRTSIQRKIGWPQEGGDDDPRPFLEAFYAALRAHLEARMLLGERREDKHDAG